MEFPVLERLAVHRMEVLISILLFVLPWYLHGVTYPIRLIQELDHCPELACDFVRHYLPQADSVRMHSTEINNGWFYPPLLAMILIPFTILNNPEYFWTIFNIMGVVVLIRMIRSGSNIPLLFTGALCTTSLPILHSLKWGQVSIWLSLLLCMAILPNGVNVESSVSPDNQTIKPFFQDKWRAWVLGFAAAIKIYPIIFILIPLIRKRLQWVLHCFVALVIFGVVVPWLWLGDDILRYLYAIERGQQIVTDMGITAGGQALGPALHRWFVSGEFIGTSSNGAWSESALLLSIPLIKPLLMMIVLGLLVKMSWYQKEHVLDTKSLFLWLILIHLLLQPGWVHYFCWLPLVHVWCWYKAKDRPKVLILLSVAIILERLPLLLLNQTTYFAFSRGAWMTVVLLITSLSLILLRKDLSDQAG